MSLCSKPGCARPGIAVLAYVYARQQIVLADASDLHVSPHEYLLCGPCSERLRPPRGWSLEDRRTSPADSPVDIRIVESRPASRPA